MLTEDYILRMINQALAVIMAALGLKKAGKYKEALQSLDQAKEILLGLDPHLVGQLTDNALLDLLTSFGNLDLERLKLLADIYREEGEIFEQLELVGNSHFSYQRSLRLYLEGVLAGEANTNIDIIEKIEELRKKLTVSKLAGETCLAILDYLDRLLESGDEFLVSAGLTRAALQIDHSVISANCDLNQL